MLLNQPMPQATSHVSVRSTPPAELPASPAVREHVWHLLSRLYPPGKGGERRKERRYPYPQLLHLTPVAADGISPTEATIVVAGKHLSEQGLGFFHREPLIHRRIIASLEEATGWIGLLTDVSWCRFTRHGWYESGGRFLQVVPSPLRRR